MKYMTFMNGNRDTRNQLVDVINLVNELNTFFGEEIIIRKLELVGCVYVLEIECSKETFEDIRVINERFVETRELP